MISLSFSNPMFLIRGPYVQSLRHALRIHWCFSQQVSPHILRLLQLWHLLWKALWHLTTLLQH